MDKAETVWNMQKEAFAELYERYRDTDTNPACEPLEKTEQRMAMPATYFYLIEKDRETVGAIRVYDAKDGTPKRISPLFIAPAHRNMGYASDAILEAERIHGADNWELMTIREEAGNCHLYEKMGYSRTDVVLEINKDMTLVQYKK
ncbi:MAG: GNAT family N-acetyltransferase [Oscillospiraceae bacterium]|nr:GNAT family N-acetyltransferase [Oscillospiraceae bacterium]